jgi:hypothetical protein
MLSSQRSLRLVALSASTEGKRTTFGRAIRVKNVVVMQTGAREYEEMH